MEHAAKIFSKNTQGKELRTAENTDDGCQERESGDTAFMEGPLDGINENPEAKDGQKEADEGSEFQWNGAETCQSSHTQLDQFGQRCNWIGRQRAAARQLRPW